MKSRRTKIGLTLLGIVLASSMSFAASASARTQGYDIWNLSSQTLKITGVDAKTNPVGEGPVFEEGPGKAPPPSTGELLKPGEHIHVELERPIEGAERVAKIVFSPSNAAPGIYAFYALLRTEFETACVRAPGTAQQCEVNGGTIRYLDPPGHKFEIDSNDIIGQRKAITELCTMADSCKFHPEQESQTRTAGRVVGQPISACQQPEGTKIVFKDGVGTTNSFGATVSASASFFEFFKSGITLTYGHARTESKEFSQELPLEVPPFEIGWMIDKAPVIRDTGKYTLVLGNTEWIIKNVYFDSPNPNKVGLFGGRFKKMDAKEKEECIKEGEEGPEGGGKKLTLLSPSAVHLSEAGDGKANLMQGFAESNTSTGLAGDDVILGGGGNDTLNGGGGDDTINGGQGEDAINGGSGADHIVDLSGPTIVNTGTDNTDEPDYVDVRDGANDDIVICESPNSVVIADRRDQVDGECGRVIRGTQVSGSQSGG
jgi:hypothetical protein